MPLDDLINLRNIPAVLHGCLYRETSLSKNMSVSSEMFTIFSKRAGLRLLDIQFYGHGLPHPSYILYSRAANLGPSGLLSYSPILHAVQTFTASCRFADQHSVHISKTLPLGRNSSLLGKMARFASLSKLTLTFPTVTKSTCSVLGDPSSSFVSNIPSTLSHSGQISCII